MILQAVYRSETPTKLEPYLTSIGTVQGVDRNKDNYILELDCPAINYEYDEEGYLVLSAKTEFIDLGISETGVSFDQLQESLYAAFEEGDSHAIVEIEKCMDKDLFDYLKDTVLDTAFLDISFNEDDSEYVNMFLHKFIVSLDKEEYEIKVEDDVLACA